jgi:hypothetical protein
MYEPYNGIDVSVHGLFTVNDFDQIVGEFREWATNEGLCLFQRLRSRLFRSAFPTSL